MGALKAIKELDEKIADFSQRRQKRIAELERGILDMAERLEGTQNYLEDKGLRATPTYGYNKKCLEQYAALLDDVKGRR
jgi:hypothetical protein